MNLSFIDIISLASYLIAIENLQENQEQSEANDVNKANDKQAQFLLSEIDKRLDVQNELLRIIYESINKKTN
jgi:hypothetical protein